jgi:oligopeptide/dipeptide ABC transporter ATP-binding protein
LTAIVCSVSYFLGQCLTAWTAWDGEQVENVTESLPLVQVEDLAKSFASGGFLSGLLHRRRVVQAVRGVSFSIPQGETFALIGESGCGKTTVALLVLRLLEPTRGALRFSGRDVLKLDRKELRDLRREAQMIFQSPQEALDPRRRVSSLLEEPLRIHGLRSRTRYVPEIAKMVGLPDRVLKAYPRELSGGQQQRVCICRALVLRPRFLVLDEPTSALDVSVQAQVLLLLQELKRDAGLTFLFISHDAAVVSQMAQRVGVMYLGRLVEVGTADAILLRPLHPYTKALVNSILTPESRLENISVALRGSPPSPATLRPGCAFASRCEQRTPQCDEVDPKLEEMSHGHFVACPLLTSPARSGEA